MMATQKGSWQQMLGETVNAINDTPKEVLHREAPSKVLSNPEVKFMLLQDKSRGLRHSAEHELDLGVTQHL